MSDRIAVMFGGRIVQCDRPEEIYQHPRTRAVAEFIGGMNFLEAAVVGESGDLIEIDVAGFGRAAEEASRRPLKRQRHHRRCAPGADDPAETGRASRRERLCQCGYSSVVSLQLKKKQL